MASQSQPDPVIYRRDKCVRCDSKMGAIRVYSGLNDPSKAQNRGKIVQTCTSQYCFWTTFHTNVAYIVEDAEALVERVNYRELGLPIPDALLKPLRLAAPPPPPPTQINGTNAISCATSTCKTATGGRTRGCQTCIEFKCLTCCKRAYNDALAANTPRNSCRTHHVAAAAGLPSAATVQRPVPPTPPTAAPMAPAVTQPSAPELEIASASAGQQAIPSESQAPASSQVVPAPPARRGRNHLAQPIGPLWRGVHSTAVQEDAARQDLKAQQREMEERQKRTIEIVIYYEPDVQPLILQEYISTFPSLQLSALPKSTLDALELTSTSKIDCWQGCWKIIDIQTVLAVEKNRSVLLRLRPSLLKELSLAQCPDIMDHLARQPRVMGVKRTGQPIETVSPIKKTAVSAPAPDVTIIDDHSHNSPVHAVHQQPLASPAGPSRATTVQHDTLPPSDKLKSSKRAEREWLSDLPLVVWDDGWKEIKRRKDLDKKCHESISFPKVFNRPYKKSTVSKYKALFSKLGQHGSLRERYIAMGNVPSASFEHAVREMESTTPESPDLFLPLHGADPSSSLLPLPNSLPPAVIPNDFTLATPSTPRHPTLSPPSGSTHHDFEKPASATPLSMPPLRNLPRRTAVPRTPRRDQDLGTRLRLPESGDPEPRDSFDLDSPLKPRGFEFVGNPWDSCFDEPDQPCDGVVPDPIADMRAIGRAQHWPDSIDCNKLACDIAALQPDLEALFEELHESDLFSEAVERCIASLEFQRSLGYFGTQGYSVIAASIRTAFPASHIDAELFAPLSYEALVEQVLIPETQRLLIAQRLSLSPSSATRVLHDSSTFGLFFNSDLKDIGCVDNSSHSNVRSNSDDIPPPTNTPQHEPFPELSPLFNVPDLPNLPDVAINAESEPLKVIDPAMLCSFCDEPLPQNPSAELVSLRVELERKSRPDPIPSNRGHRKAHIMDFASYCRLHTFERDILPMALAHRWPSNPDFSSLFHRITRLRHALIVVCDEPDNSSFFRTAKDFYTPRSIASSTEPHQSLSSAQLQSSLFQFGSVERFHALGAGYYGEIGYQIFDVALRFMFPDSNVELEPFFPLTYDTVLREVLIPEAAQRIVQEDLDLTPREAKDTLKASHVYGVMKHPSSLESPALEEAIQTATRIKHRANSKYTSWLASKSNLGFLEWAQEQTAVRVKLEPQEVILRPRGVSGQGHGQVFIDLTSDDD